MRFAFIYESVLFIFFIYTAKCFFFPLQTTAKRLTKREERVNTGTGKTNESERVNDHDWLL